MTMSMSTRPFALSLLVLAAILTACGATTPPPAAPAPAPPAPAAPAPAVAVRPAENPIPPKLRLPDVAVPKRQAVTLNLDPTREGFEGGTQIDLELRGETDVIW